MNNKIGIDIVEVKRFAKYEKGSRNSLSKFFTKKELDICFNRVTPSLSLAGKFAAKEAVIKALSNSGITITDLNLIEILNDERGKPFVNKGSELSKDGIELSISHDGGFAVAIALIES